MTESNQDEREDSKANSKFSRRDFLKYGAGVAAVAAGASAMLRGLPLPSAPTRDTSPPSSASSGPIVVAVDGDELTVMSGHSEVKVRDSVLAADIARRVQ